MRVAEERILLLRQARDPVVDAEILSEFGQDLVLDGAGDLAGAVRVAFVDVAAHLDHTQTVFAVDG